MKKCCLILVSVILLIGIAEGARYINYLKSFAIAFDSSKNPNNDKKILENIIEEHINRGTLGKEDIDVKEWQDFKGKVYILYTSKDYMGDAELVRGPNGKYKIKSLRNGTSYLRYRYGQKGKEKYIVILGKNIDMKIQYLKTNIGVFTGNPSVEQEYFIRFEPAPSNYSEDKFPEEVSIRAYDKNDVDITDEVYK